MPLSGPTIIFKNGIPINTETNLPIIGPCQHCGFPSPADGFLCISCSKQAFTPTAELAARWDAEKRQPPATGYHPDAALNLHYVRSRGYYPKFNEALAWRGISASQAREAAHLLNQLAEYLEHADK